MARGSFTSRRRAPAASRSARIDAHRFREAPVAFEMVAVLAMAGGVLGLRQQQSVAAMRARLGVVLEQREPQLLVVRVVADLDGGARERLDQRRAIVTAGEIGRGERDRLVGPE